MSRHDRTRAVAGARQQVLSTPRRHAMLAGTPIVSVPVLRSGRFDSLKELTTLIGPSTCRTASWRSSLLVAAAEAGLAEADVVAQTDQADEMEGLYLKVEEDGRVVGRFKWVRFGFLQALLDSGSHWSDRPIIANRLADPGVLYAGL